MTRRIITCARCRRDRKVHARGLCASCYTTTRKDGMLHLWPVQPRPRQTPRQLKHGARALAVVRKCDCEPCTAYREKFLAYGSTLSAMRRNRPLTLGDPRLADPTILARLAAGIVVSTCDPHDHAAIIGGVRAGRIGRAVAMKAMYRSAAVLDAALAALEAAA